MERIVGTRIWSLRGPIFRAGDDLTAIVPDLIAKFWDQESVQIGEKDIIAITESVVARTQNNYAHVDSVAADLDSKLQGEVLGIVFPILSRNRFAIILRAIARSSFKKFVLLLKYPSDEVGNQLVTQDELDDKRVDPWRDVLELPRFRELFGERLHPFTGLDYIDYYKSLVEKEGKECEVVLGNDPTAILFYTQKALACDIHTRARTKRVLREAGAECIGLDDLMTAPVDGSGFNADYGLLGSNKSTEDRIKLFPRDCQPLVEAIQAELLRRTGKTLEVMVYGDGAFRDPVGQIWELADPVVSPGFTRGLEGTPSELKLKYLADNEFGDLRGDDLKHAIENAIRQKESNLVGSMRTQGTTPRRLTDLLGSLADLTTGSGDKGTPLVYIQGYFDNYAQ
ncbi:MAG TPA: coenzyme F420-0:L-glutamate ligase [Bellilinea sp.]|nr:coenzyme F420-0:L-glutamate ligase [Bellilinea sp.]